MRLGGGMRSMLALLALLAAWLWPQPEAKAFCDPVTICLLAPIAMKATEVSMPYVMRGLIGGGRTFMKMAKDVFDICVLPVGMGELAFGWYFGLAPDGIKNTQEGIVAPFKLCWHALMLPVSIFASSLLE